MSASMADAITLEKHGMPAVLLGSRKLAETTGRGMAAAHGVPDFPFAAFSHDLGSTANLMGDTEIHSIAQVLAGQVASMLTGRKSR